MAYLLLRAARIQSSAESRHFCNKAVSQLRISTMATSALSTPFTLRQSNPDMPETHLPKFVYGTAWKKEQTADLVYLALKSGFRGFDTAAQPRHYREDLVGEGLRRAISEGIVSRNEVFVQTKYSPPSAQDVSNMPYSPSLPIEEQVHASVASSLKNLFGSDGNSSETAPQDAYLDSLVMHSPLATTAATLAAWRALESHVPHRIRHLGISNVTLPVLQALEEEEEEEEASSSASSASATTPPRRGVRPSVVQNRFYAATRWEGGMRAFCRDRRIVFQSFWTLSGNPALAGGEAVRALAKAAGAGAAEALYALVVGLEGVTVLNGTRNEGRMRGDLQSLEKIGRWAEGEGRAEWEECLAAFKAEIAE